MRHRRRSLDFYIYILIVIICKVIKMFNDLIACAVHRLTNISMAPECGHGSTFTSTYFYIYPT